MQGSSDEQTDVRGVSRKIPDEDRGDGRRPIVRQSITLTCNSGVSAEEWRIRRNQLGRAITEAIKPEKGFTMRSWEVHRVNKRGRKAKGVKSVIATMEMRADTEAEERMRGEGCLTDDKIVVRKLREFSKKLFDRVLGKVARIASDRRTGISRVVQECGSISNSDRMRGLWQGVMHRARQSKIRKEAYLAIEDSRTGEVTKEAKMHVCIRWGDLIAKSKVSGATPEIRMSKTHIVEGASDQEIDAAMKEIGHKLPEERCKRLYRFIRETGSDQDVAGNHTSVEDPTPRNLNGGSSSENHCEGQQMHSKAAVIIEVDGRKMEGVSWARVDVEDKTNENIDKDIMRWLRQHRAISRWQYDPDLRGVPEEHLTKCSKETKEEHGRRHDRLKWIEDNTSSARKYIRKRGRRGAIGGEGEAIESDIMEQCEVRGFAAMSQQLCAGSISDPSNRCKANCLLDSGCAMVVASSRWADKMRDTYGNE